MDPWYNTGFGRQLQYPHYKLPALNVKLTFKICNHIAKLQGCQVTWVILNDFWGLGIVPEHLYGLKITLIVKTQWLFAVRSFTLTHCSIPNKERDVLDWISRYSYNTIAYKYKFSTLCYNNSLNSNSLCSWELSILLENYLIKHMQFLWTSITIQNFDPILNDTSCHVGTVHDKRIIIKMWCDIQWHAAYVSNRVPSSKS